MPQKYHLVFVHNFLAKFRDKFWLTTYVDFQLSTARYDALIALENWQTPASV